MLGNGRAWFLLADGRRARLWIEHARGARLTQDWSMEISDEDLYDPQDRPPRSQESVGGQRHAMDRGRNLHEAEEEKFLRRVAERVKEEGKRGHFDHLVIAAPPRALGILRNTLPERVKAKIKAETPKDLIDEDAQALTNRLRDLLH